MKKAYSVIICGLSAILLAAAAPGPAGGQVVGDKTSSFEVKINPDKGRVEVQTLKADTKGPRRMEITLFSADKTSQTIELRAINPTEKFPRFQGELGPNAGSVAGFELKFGFDLKALKALPYVPYTPSRGQ